MRKKKIKINYSEERVVLSDVLPYETPLIFSNRYFYKFLKNRSKTMIRKVSGSYTIFEDLLFKNGNINRPFVFKTKHKESDFRELNVIHPKNQLDVTGFYKKYKSLIIYYCSISPFSIRKPTKVANFTFYNDLLHLRNEDNCLEHSAVEEENNEYENLKSFFAYQKYSNIHKFYESYQFHRSEKKFNHLLKIDVSKCFDSIYTHTSCWAIFNKHIVKSNIDSSLDTFPGEFDKLMQTLNANETNGIVIGPEFSRIFAEIILQQIDKNIYENLWQGTDSQKKLLHKKDYEIFRYVDDYFVFYNTDDEKEIILKQFKLSLKEYKLYLNENKSIKYDKPIITEITLAKQRISDLFDNHLVLKENYEEDILKNLYFSSNNVITRFKSIVKETNVDYKDIMNYSLAVLDNKTGKLIKKWKTLDNFDQKYQRQFEKGFLEILDVSFFLYSVAPRVNSTIKLCLILHKIINFLKKNKTNLYKEPFAKHHKNNVFKKISDEIFLVLQKNKTQLNTPVESLYLLIALDQLGREYRLSPKNLCSYFNIEYSGTKPKIIEELNYFNIVVLLFYIKDIQIYRDIKEELKIYILNKFEKRKIFDWKNETELVILLLDILTCPFLDDDSSYQKSKIKLKKAQGKTTQQLKKYIIEEKNKRYTFKKSLLTILSLKDNKIGLIESQKYWFIKWTNFDFGLELQAKRSQEVY